MNLNPNHHPVPELLATPTFVIRRQRPEDNAADHEAEMDSKAVLREWNDSLWPEDGFTLEQNAKDIAEHIEEHAHDLNYGFSIFTPTTAPAGFAVPQPTGAAAGKLPHRPADAGDTANFRYPGGVLAPARYTGRIRESVCTRSNDTAKARLVVHKPSLRLAQGDGGAARTLRPTWYARGRHPVEPRPNPSVPLSPAHLG